MSASSESASPDSGRACLRGAEGGTGGETAQPKAAAAQKTRERLDAGLGLRGGWMFVTDQRFLSLRWRATAERWRRAVLTIWQLNVNDYTSSLAAAHPIAAPIDWVRQ